MLSAGMIFILGLALFFNIAVIKLKLERERYADATLDGVVLVGLAWFMGGTLNGMILATVASAMFSIYLWISPPQVDWDSL